MTIKTQYEFCEVCDCATGNSGRGDGSLYVIDSEGKELGPLCEICYEIYTNEDTTDKGTTNESDR